MRIGIPITFYYWDCIDTGLASDWQWFGRVLAEDWLSIDTGLSQDWHRIGTGFRQDWHSVDAQVMRFGSLLALDWPQIDNSLAQEWHLIVIKLAIDWQWIGIRLAASDWWPFGIGLVTDNPRVSASQRLFRMDVCVAQYWHQFSWLI